MAENKAKFASREKDAANLSFSQGLEKIFSGISSRAQDIVKLRYGIGNSAPKTLEEIGKKYNITRERIRQIIRETFKKLLQANENHLAEKIEDQIRFTINEKSGIMEKKELISALSQNSQKERGAIQLFLDLFGDIRDGENEILAESFYVLSDFNSDDWKKTISEVEKLLENIKNPISENELFEKYSRINGNISQKKLFDFLSVSRNIKKNKFNKWGLKKWNEITPKGTREKIYLILKEKGEPMHFRQIAKSIDDFKLGIKKSNPQTVHNELIRDERFILIGRGTYALSEWGYKKGTVKDVLNDILKKNSQPMKKDQIMNEILRHRKVKKTTVVINLNNYFVKVGKDLYSLEK